MATTVASMDDTAHGTPTSGTAGANTGWVKILNESWPPTDVARRLGDRPIDEQIPVTVRVEFETGTEHMAGMATRWHGQHVRVSIPDRRVVSYGVWVNASDVTRA